MTVSANIRSRRFLVFSVVLSAIFLPFLLMARLSVAQPPSAAPAPFLWGKEPVEVSSRTRAEIVLNGPWKFLPLTANERPDDRADWGVIRVPGDWTQDAGGNRPGVETRGETWKNTFLGNVTRAWYQRTITIPENWRGRAITLDFERVSTDAVVYLDGQECGRISWPAGEVDLSRVAQPGQTHTLLVSVVATADADEVLSLLESGRAQASKSQKSLESRGIIGDVVLKSRPTGPYVSDVFVQPSVRQKFLGLTVELRDVRQAGDVRLIGHLFNEKDREEKRFTATVPAKEAEKQTVMVRFPWANPRLWDIGKPNRYTLRLEAVGNGLDDEYAQDFGFREFWISSRKFFLNGTEIRLRPMTAPQQYSATEGTTELIDAAVDGMTWAGFNVAELWPFDVDERGVLAYHDRWADRADRKGFALTGVVPSIHPYLFDANYRSIWSPEKRDAWLARVEPVLRRLRNHPSIMMWAPSANFFGTNADQDPRYIGMRNQPPRNDWGRQMVAAGNEGIAYLRRLDPTRPIFTHQGAEVGDVFATNTYLDFLPLQDRMEWLSRWAAKGDMPFLAVEFGTPLHTSFMRGRSGFPDAIQSEPLMTEFSAIYLGADAYKQETADYRRRIVATYEGGQKWKNWQGAREMETAPAFQAVESLFITNTWRAWRTSGITGGMVPWNSGHGWYGTAESAKRVPLPPFVPGRRGTYPGTVPKSALYYLRPESGDTLAPGGKALLENDGQTLAWICGAPGQTMDRTHHFFPGGTVHKQIALLNDSRSPQQYDYTWTVTVNGRAVARGAGRGALAVSETRLAPLTFSTPRVTSRAEGMIYLRADIGGSRHTDQFRFRVYPSQPAARGRVAVYGGPGPTTAMLKSLGYTVEPFGPRMNAPLLVVERDALGRSNGAILTYLDAYVRNGGRLLMMEQNPDWLRKNLGLRVAPTLARRVFPVEATNPIVSGLDARDLCDWTGASMLVPPYPAYDDKNEYAKAPSGMPYAGWRWGSRHAVSSAPIEKPHRSGWRPLLECEFDLAYTPLMELDYGRGRVVLCTLDLEDHTGPDPAARKLAAQVVRYAATAPLAPRIEHAVLLGDDRDAALLDDLGVVYERANTPTANASLIIVGRKARYPVDGMALTTALAKGVRVFYLPREVGNEAEGFRLTRRGGFSGSLNIPNWPECRGLSASDLRWRAEGEATLLTGGPTGNSVPQGQVGADGLLARVSAPNRGTAIFCQMDPDALKADERAYFRYTRWRETRALSQLLANLGASFRQDGRIFKPGPDPEAGMPLAGTWRVKTIKSESLQNGPLTDPGASRDARTAAQPLTNDASWETANLPGMWKPFDSLLGEAVFRRMVEIPAEWAGKDLTLTLGPVDDNDDTYWNGQRIGGTTGWNTLREYTIPGRLVKAGRSLIAVRVFNNFGGGGFGGAADTLRLIPKGAKPAATLYCPDYRTDFALGDDPYRYYRW